MIKKKLFLASSSELKEDREQFEIFISRKNKDWIDRGDFPRPHHLGRLFSTQFPKPGCKTNTTRRSGNATFLSCCLPPRSANIAKKSLKRPLVSSRPQISRLSLPISKIARSIPAAPTKRIFMSLWAFQEKLGRTRAFLYPIQKHRRTEIQVQSATGQISRQWFYRV